MTTSSRRLARAGTAVRFARQGGDGRPGDVGGPAGETGVGIRGRGPAGDLTRAVKEDLGSPALLEQPSAANWSARERRVRTSLRLSGLPTGQTLANFDFAFQPAVQRPARRWPPAPLRRSRDS